MKEKKIVRVMILTLGKPKTVHQTHRIAIKSVKTQLARIIAMITFKTEQIIKLMKSKIKKMKIKIIKPLIHIKNLKKK